MINIKLRDNVLELLKDETVHYKGHFRHTEHSIPCSVLFRANDFYVKQNKKAYDSLNKAVHQYYREYFRENNIEHYIKNELSLNVWSIDMRDENNRTVDEMLDDISDSNELKAELNEFPAYSNTNVSRRQRLINEENYVKRTINYVQCLYKTDDTYCYLKSYNNEHFNIEDILKIEEKYDKAYCYIMRGQTAKKNEMRANIQTLQYMKHFRSHKLQNKLEEMKRMSDVNDAKIYDSEEYKHSKDVVQQMIDAK